jgi:CDP-diacylglycerol--serine O-phosphatidyltransferase
MLDARSEMGNILDSLADVVSFGVAPSIVMFNLLNTAEITAITPGEDAINLSYFGILLALTAGWRLARFSSSTTNRDYFLGLPAPAAGLFIAALPLIKNRYREIDPLFNLLNSQIALLIILVVISFLMVSRIPLLSMKFKNLKWSDNASRYILAGISLILIGLIQCAALPLIIISYIILSIVELNSSKSINN